MKILSILLFAFLYMNVFAQSKQGATELWLENNSGKKLEGVYNFKKKPVVQDTIALGSTINIRITSANTKATVKYVMVYHFRDGKDIFIGEAEDKLSIVLEKYTPKKGDLFVVQVALKDKTEKQFCFMIE